MKKIFLTILFLSPLSSFAYDLGTPPTWDGSTEYYQPFAVYLGDNVWFELIDSNNYVCNIFQSYGGETAGNLDSSNYTNATCNYLTAQYWEIRVYDYDGVDRGDFLSSTVTVFGIVGCMDHFAINYSPTANIESGSCIYYEVDGETVARGIGSLNFGLLILITFVSIGMTAFIWNTFNKKRKW